MNEETVENKLKKAETAIANYSDQQLWLLYQKLKNTPENNFMELPLYLAGSDLSEEDFNSLNPNQKAAHKFASYLRRELKGAPAATKRALIMQEILECHRHDILGLTLNFEQYEGYGMDFDWFRLGSPAEFKQLLMLMVSGKM